MIGGSPTGGKDATMRIPNDDNEDLGWQEYANCLGVDPDLFFPERGASTREAK
jgi:WhiB family redox-sensing transcriptional regulator